MRYPMDHEYESGDDTTDLLIRNVPAEDIAGLDVRAAKLGLSRADYLRRLVGKASAAGTEPATPDSLSRMADAISDLKDPEIIRNAWS